MRTQDAKQIHMKDLLQALGHKPERQDKGEWWFCSPLRKETKPSFKLSRDGKAWYDHGAGIGGNILKFICVYYGIQENDIRSALAKLDELNIARASVTENPASQPAQPSLWENSHQRTVDDRREASKTSNRANHQKEEDDTLSITRIVPVQSMALIQYLHERGIDKETARPWVQEMHYKRGSGSFYSLAFSSDSGGYELRSRGFKSAQGKKDITLLNRDSRAGKMAVFEGFFDFLSWIQHTGQKKLSMPVLVLNSVGLKKRAAEAIEKLENIQTVHVYADRDKSGKDLVQYMQERLDGIHVIDESSLYASFHDYNEFVTQNRVACCLP